MLSAAYDKENPILIGRTLGHYRIIEQIGAGGMGVVYRARDERLERDVALKVLPAGLLDDETARGRFRKEAQALAKLNHPHIGTVYDFDTQDGVDFLVMEYIAGTTLDGKLVSSTLTEREVLILGAQIALALEEAHERGVVHRDLKPSNIMVNQKGRAKVLDFGLARLFSPKSDATAAPTVTEARHAAGTLPYMAPEQLRGESVDARSDIHALGAVLYEMATSRRAFQEDLQPRLIDAILNRVPAAPRALNPALEIDNTLAEAHVSLAEATLKHDWNWPQAEREYRRAIELNPSYAEAHLGYGTYLESLSRFDEAIAERKRAFELDPLSAAVAADVGYPMYYAGKHDQAVDFYRSALELDPSFFWANLWIGQAWVQKGLYPEAIAEIKKAVDLSKRSTRPIATLGHAYAVSGQKADAYEILNELQVLSKQKYVSPYYTALIYAGLEKSDQAFEYLEKAFEERQPYLILVNVEPVFANLRSDPRFHNLLRRIGLRS
jgi:serine/threonine protein kinase